MRRFVRAADIHARTPPHRLQPLQNLDRGGRIAGLARRSASAGRRRLAGRLLARGRAEQVAVMSHQGVS